MTTHDLICVICGMEDSCDEIMLPSKLSRPCSECGGVMRVVKSTYEKEGTE